jgi:hypothetical protein
MLMNQIQFSASRDLLLDLIGAKIMGLILSNIINTGKIR